MPFDESQLAALFDTLRDESPELIPICRWLVLGPWLASTVLPEHARPPSVSELVALKTRVERAGTHYAGLLEALLSASGAAPAIRIEAQLDRLLELDPTLWSHPAQVLDRPFCDAAELLAACRGRLEEAGEEVRPRLTAMEEKLVRTVRIEDRARERRERRGD
ncbi:MAG: hypothetical protein AAF657_20990 [Acidobacteriota bacterium]